MNRWLGLPSTSKTQNEHENVCRRKRQRLDYEANRKMNISKSLVDKWHLSYRWLESERQGNEYIFKCKWCVKAGKNNIFTIGNVNIKVDSLTKHEKTKDHQFAITCQNSCTNKEWNKAMTAVYSNEKKSIISAMNIVYLQMKENLPTRKFSSLKNLCIDLGVQDLKNLNVDERTNYESHDSVIEMQCAISEVIQNEIVSKIKLSPWYSIMADESTDISAIQSMIVYAKYLTEIDGKQCVATSFLKLIELPGCTAKDLYTELCNILNEYELPKSKICGVATDGASIMTGVRSGLTTHLKKDAPQCIAIHCIAHRLALVSSQAADKVPYLLKYQDILNRIYSYFNQSPKRTRLLKEMYETLHTEKSKFVHASTTRWLSLCRSVECIRKNWSVLVSTLMEDSSAFGTGLLKSVTSFRFVAVTAFISDVLLILNKLCLAFQKQNIDFSFAKCQIDITIKCLEDLSSGCGENYKKFMENVPDKIQDFVYENYTIRDSKKERGVLENLKQDYIKYLLQNLNERFVDADKLEMFSVFCPQNLPLVADNKKFQNYGVKEIESIFNLIYLDDTDSSLSEVLSEWKLFKNFLSSRCRTMNLADTIDFIRKNDLHQLYPIMCNMLHFAAILPLHSVDCERGFSVMNATKTKLRNRMYVRNVNNVISVCVNGPNRQQYNFETAFEVWASMKSRRILEK